MWMDSFIGEGMYYLNYPIPLLTRKKQNKNSRKSTFMTQLLDY